MCLTKIRSIIFSDEKFIEDMKINRGVDLINKKFNDFAASGGIDSSFI